MVKALELNTWFTGVSVSNMRVGGDLMASLCSAVEHSASLRILVSAVMTVCKGSSVLTAAQSLHNCSIARHHAPRLAEAVEKMSSPGLEAIDLGANPFDDTGACRVVNCRVRAH
jgi:hypothetical protein